MNLLSDEILNKYLDGELDQEKIAEVESTLEKSEPDMKRFNVLKLVHSNLSSMKEEQVSEDFTLRLMKNLNKKFVLPKQQKYLIVSVSSFIVLICLGILGYVISAILSAPVSHSQPLQVMESVQNVTTGLITELKKIFSGTNLSIIGSIISFALIISGYLFFEQQKQIKSRLGS